MALDSVSALHTYVFVLSLQTQLQLIKLQIFIKAVNNKLIETFFERDVFRLHFAITVALLCEYYH